MRLIVQKCSTVWRLVHIGAVALIFMGLLALPMQVMAQAKANDKDAAAAQTEAKAPLPQTINLRPQWKAGQTSRYQMWSRRVEHRTVSVGDQQRENEVVIETTGEVTWTVKRVDATGGVSGEMTLDWMQMTVRPPKGKPHVNDSRKASGDDPPLHDILKAMTGTPVRVEMAADGSIERVSGTCAIQQRIQPKEMAPTDLDFMESANDLAAIAAAPGEAAIGDDWDVRHKWSYHISGPLDGFVHEDMQWRVANIERHSRHPRRHGDGAVGPGPGSGSLEDS